MERLLRKGIQCMVKEGSMLSRVTAGVTIVVVIATLSFGMKLYAGQGDRYTATDARADQAKVFLYNESVYVHKDLSEQRYDVIIARLDRIERKIDAAAMEK